MEVTDNLSFEYNKYLKANNEIIKELWKIANTEVDLADNTIDPSLIMGANLNNKNRIAALSALQETYDHRMELMTGGSKTTHDREGLTIMNHAYTIKE